ncbi:hypothetical protein [Marinomonas sp. THO17]|uniref:hypothetical protein n=1 Tax=Marinomonas sp. THO17 TaxID=3149048 RepID=UPI00336BEBCF
MLKQMMVILLVAFSGKVMAQAILSEQEVSVEPKEMKEFKQDIFELERSLAILQLAKASTEEVAELRQTLLTQQERLDILMNVMFLLLVSLILMAWKLGALKKRQLP